MTPADHVIIEAKVEFYAGRKSNETPTAIVIAGQRFGVRAVLRRERIEDAATRMRREVWHCRLEDGRVMKVELLESGAVRVSGLD
jgi:hypothetical protein